MDRVETTTLLRTWLADRTPEQLTELLEQHAVPETAGYTHADVTTLHGLAEHLLSDDTVATAAEELNARELQVLSAVAGLAHDIHGPLPASAQHTYGPPHGHGTSGAFDEEEPAHRAVPREKLLDRLTDDAAQRAAAETVLRELQRRALVLLPDSTSVIVAMLWHRRALSLQRLGRPADPLLTQAFNATEIHHVAAGLGIPRQRTRDEAQRSITATLSDTNTVRTLVTHAPDEAHDLLKHLVTESPLLRTHCFTTRFGYVYSSTTKYIFREETSGDPGTDWLAARGMLLPIGPDLVELPYEVGKALRDPEERPRFDATPPRTCDVVPLPREVSGETQAALTETASRVERVLRGVADRPLAVRKAGGIAVRETRALAKNAGVPEKHTRLWLDLASNAGLLAPQQADVPSPRGRGGNRASTSKPSTRLLPTQRYDPWAAATPVERVTPLLVTWAVTPEVFSYWPDDHETPVALVSPQDPASVPLRHALLDVFAHLPAGYGLSPGSASALDSATLSTVLEDVGWYRPLLDQFGDDLADRAAATLEETELLGVTAHGALTPVGEAVRALLHAGAGRHFPAVPGVGMDPTGRPALAAALQQLDEALCELLPPPQTTARFQADLTAVVTGAPSAELTELLSTVADRESEGHAVVWRISAASLRRAFDAGMDATDLRDRLRAASESGTALPQPLEYLLTDTARSHGRMRVVRSACCVRSDDEALVAELSQARALRTLGLRRIAPTVLVSTASPDETLDRLRAAGYAPALEAETGDTVVRRAPEERAETITYSSDRGGRPTRSGSWTAPGLAAHLLAAH